MDLKQRLEPFIHRQSVMLKSGTRSDFYVDIKAAFGSPELLTLFARELAKRISKRATCIAGAGYGGLPLATAVAVKTNLPLVMVREQIKEHGTRQWLDGYVPGSRDRVAIIDDVYTSGRSLSHTEKVLVRTKAKIEGRYVVVNRSGREKSDVVFLIEYGRKMNEEE